MNVYIYDSYVNEKKYLQTVAKIETRITDLGLNGKIVRLGIMNSVFDIIDSEVKKGAKTIIAVGNAYLLNQCINAIAQLGRVNPVFAKTPLGFIPVGKKFNEIASYLGIDFAENACDVISARRIQKLDLGLVDKDKYFLTHAQISTTSSVIEIDKNYSLEITKAGTISVVNLPLGVSLPSEANISAEDGIIELVIQNKHDKGFITQPGGNNSSMFSFSKLRISNQKFPIVLDGTIKLTTPVNIQVAKEKTYLIVGKGRQF